MLEHDIEIVERSLDNLSELALGGTAVGTGLNSPEVFRELAAVNIAKLCGRNFRSATNKFHALTSKGALVNAYGAVKVLAMDLMKIANDIRMLASGPRCGIGELIIPENEPGSSIGL